MRDWFTVVSGLSDASKAKNRPVWQPSVLPLVTYPDKRLNQKCHDVTVFDGVFALAVMNLEATLIDHRGLGLAAPQVGDMRRYFCMLDDDHKILHFVNPVIWQKRGAQEMTEGCLSLPGIYADMPRAMDVVVVAQDWNGLEFRAEFSGLRAACVQHEIDHLNGVLMIGHDETH